MIVETVTFTIGLLAGFALAWTAAAVRRECDPMTEFLAEKADQAAAWDEGRTTPTPIEESAG